MLVMIIMFKESTIVKENLKKLNQTCLIMFIRICVTNMILFECLIITGQTSINDN